MKQILTIFFVVLLCGAWNSAKAVSPVDNKLITGLNVFDSDTTFRYVYLYDEGKKVLETKYYRSGNAWVSLSQTEWFNKSGVCSSQVERRWSNNEWQNTASIDYSYANGLLASETHSSVEKNVSRPFHKSNYRYSGSRISSKTDSSYISARWRPTLRTDYAYDQQGRVDSVLISVVGGDTIASQILLKNFYNAIGQMAAQDYKVRTSVRMPWVNHQRTEWFYRNGSQLVQLQSTKIWNSELLKWDNNQRVDYNYDSSGKMITETYSYWKQMFWQSDLRYDYLYDNNGNLIKKVLAKPQYCEWRNLISINYSEFDGYKANRMDSRYEFWGGNAGELVASYIPFVFNNEMTIQKGRSLEITYNDTISSVPQLAGKLRPVPVYPNPSDGVFYMNPTEYGVQSWILSDVSGRLLKSQSQVTSGVIDLSDLPKGIYLLRLSTQTGNYTQKLFRN